MKPEDIERVKDLLPTNFGSEEIKTHYAREILQRSIWSARMSFAHYLAKLRDVCTAISAGKINQADARAQLLTVLEQMGHSPQDGGGLKNPASIRRLNLILDTQTQMASSVARLAEQTDATVNLQPVQVRIDAAKAAEDYFQKIAEGRINPQSYDGGTGEPTGGPAIVIVTSSRSRMDADRLEGL